MRSAIVVACCAVFFCGLVGTLLTRGGLIDEPARPAASLAEANGLIKDSVGKLSLSFIENQGQADARVAYYIQSPGHSLYFTRTGHALRLKQGEGEAVRAHTVKVELVEAATERVESLEPAPGVVSYFKGPKEQWKAGIPTHARIGYVQPWPGIDLSYNGHGGKLESIYTVAPHANPKRIRLRYSGQDSLKLDAAGNLIYTTSAGEVKETAPVSYQDIDGKRVPVESHFSIFDKNTVGFEVAAYDPDHALVIDPTLVYAGFIGGSDFELAGGIAVDSDGNAYVVGTTGSAETSFPDVGGPDLSKQGADDVFVAKVSADGTTLVYAGYLGGAGTDEGRGIAVDSAGSAYVTGSTQSVETSFPVVGGPDVVHNGSVDAFVAKINASGTALDYAGYIGGSELEAGNSIAVDSDGNAYVAGTTDSTETSFPEITGPDLSANGLGDAFVAKVNAAGTLVYAGYIGGSGSDLGNGIAVDSAGNAYVTGDTASSGSGFPAVTGPDLTSNGGSDAFVAKVNAAGTALAYAGFIGGSGFEAGSAIAVDALGSAYVTGFTSSAHTSFPVAVGPDLTYNFSGDAFVAKVNGAGTGLVYAGYIGGISGEAAYGIAVDAAGNAYVTGDTSSTEASFPVLEGPDLTLNGGDDAFVAKVNAGGTALNYAGYIGGDTNDYAYGIAVDTAGNAYVVGNTTATESTFPEVGGPDLTANGSIDAFVAKIDDTTTDPFSIVDQAAVARSAQITSAAVIVSGIAPATAISVTSGSYSIDGAAFTTGSEAVNNGQSVRVRHTSSASFSTTTDTVLTVGGVSDTFTSTTQAQDTTPNTFSFTDQVGVALSTLMTSNAVTIAGINDTADISVTGGAYSIGCTATFVTAPATITNGQTVCVQHTSSASNVTVTNTVLTVGGVSDTFTSTTVAAPAASGGGGGGSLDWLTLLALAGLAGRRRQKLAR